jgi:hypothetical protein
MARIESTFLNGGKELLIEYLNYYVIFETIVDQSMHTLLLPSSRYELQHARSLAADSLTHSLLASKFQQIRHGPIGSNNELTAMHRSAISKQAERRVIRWF